MIEINLVPGNLRKKKKSQMLLGGLNIPLEVIVGSAGGLFLILVFVHIFLLYMNISKLSQHKKLKKNWEKIAPDKKRVDTVIHEMRELQANQSAINKLTETRAILWSQKLNILSDVLPRGIWMQKISLKDDMLFIQGSAISKQQKEMISVHTLTANLKKEENFLNNITELELGSIQRRNIGKVEIADFLITAKVK